MQGTQTLADFIAEHGVTMDVEHAASNPHMSDMPRGSSHWTCTLRTDTGTMEVPFSQGSAHTQPPTVEDVLDCLASDASSVENEPDWLDWAVSMGFDGEGADELRRARSTHETIVKQSDALRDMLGPVAFETLLWSIGRA